MLYRLGSSTTDLQTQLFGNLHKICNRCLLHERRYSAERGDQPTRLSFHPKIWNESLNMFLFTQASEALLHNNKPTLLTYLISKRFKISFFGNLHRSAHVCVSLRKCKHVRKYTNRNNFVAFVSFCSVMHFQNGLTNGINALGTASVCLVFLYNSNYERLKF